MATGVCSIHGREIAVVARRRRCSRAGSVRPGAGRGTQKAAQHCPTSVPPIAGACPHPTQPPPDHNQTSRHDSVGDEPFTMPSMVAAGMWSPD